jgi:hypothetical protein
LTGADYLRQPFGPTARQLSACLQELAEEGKLELKETTYFGIPKFEFTPRAPCETNLLSASEMQLLDEISDFVRGRSAKPISELSHSAAWSAFGIGDVIPYETAYWLVPTEVTDDDVEWANRTAKQLFAA